MENEEEILNRFNQARHLFQAWPVAPIPGLTTSFVKSWLLLVPVPKPSKTMIFPALGDHFTIDIEASIKRTDGTFTLVNLRATRIQNPYEEMADLPSDLVAKCAAFQVDVPRSWKRDDGDNLELDLMASFQTANSLEDLSSLTMDPSKHQKLNIFWETFSLTYEAELAALRHFMEDSQLEDRKLSIKCKDAFAMLLDFGDSWKTWYDLHNAFPHLKDPAHPKHRISKLLVNKFKAFNADHRAAYNALTHIPNGLFFVNGCPGAGKTEWNMVVSALIQAKRRPGSRKRHSPILFVVDLNKTVDDAADRYYTLCKSAGLKLRIIRMHGWPYEMRNSDKLASCGSGSNNNNAGTEPDFTKKFLSTVSISKHTKMGRNPDKAPTLDEAAWEYYEKHKDDCFIILKRVLARMESGEVLTGENWKALRSQVTMLYRAVLNQTDFIATTPVAAYGHFSRLFRPDVIFIDEAPHARELTTLILLAFFEPIAWILTGDVKQTTPFVKGGDRRDTVRAGLKFNPHADQLRVSLMARADAAGAISSKLLINKRAFGNLHRLPSEMFYQGKMISGYSETARYPSSVEFLKSYLMSIGNVKELGENRVVVALGDSREEEQRNSFYNPAHHKWIVRQAKGLLVNSDFCSLENAKRPGTILIESPYSTAVRRYMADVKQWPRELQDRVEVLTVDKAQGNQADVVFFDSVRTTKAGFMNDPQRLNVAITRAKQAEVILMDNHMTWRRSQGRSVRAEYTAKIWDDAARGGRLFTVSSD